MPEAFKTAVRRVCSGLYEGFINAAREALPQAEVVIDRFHVAKQYNKGVDQLRQQVLRELKETLEKDSYASLKGVMWPFRRHYWDLNEDQQFQLVRLFEHSPTLKQAWILRHELFLIFETHPSPEQADASLKAWVKKVKDQALDCFDGFIALLDKHRRGILAYFDGRHSSGFVEGLNNKLKVIGTGRCQPESLGGESERPGPGLL